MSMKVLLQNDCDCELLKDKKVAILGFGAQGAAQAQNLKDSQIQVCVGLYSGSKSWERAKSLGFEVKEVSEAVKWADMIVMLLPDEVHGEVFTHEVKPHLRAGQILGFGHGFSVHYGQIDAPSGVGVVLVAPKGAGAAVRNEYLQGRGVPSLIGVEQESSEGNARAMALSYVCAIGSGRVGIMETSFKNEAETDLFGEQAVLCGGVDALVRAGFETLVEAGYPEEMAYFECFHELKLVVDLLYQGGLKYMREHISNTAEYGDIVSGDTIINSESKQAMREILARIQNGSFAKDFLLERQSGYVRLKTERKALSNHQIEIVGQKLRNMVFAHETK